MLERTACKSNIVRINSSLSDATLCCASFLFTGDEHYTHLEACTFPLAMHQCNIRLETILYDVFTPVLWVRVRVMLNLTNNWGYDLMLLNARYAVYLTKTTFFQAAAAADLTSNCTCRASCCCKCCSHTAVVQLVAGAAVVVVNLSSYSL